MTSAPPASVVEPTPLADEGHPLNDVEIERLRANLDLLVRFTPELRGMVTSSKKPTDGAHTIPGPKAPLNLSPLALLSEKPVPTETAADGVGYLSDPETVYPQSYGVLPLLRFYASWAYVEAAEARALRGEPACGDWGLKSTSDFLVRYVEVYRSSWWAGWMCQSIGYLAGEVRNATGERRPYSYDLATNRDRLTKYEGKTHKAKTDEKKAS